MGKIEEYVNKYALRENVTLSDEEISTVLAKTYAVFKLYEFVEEGNKFLGISERNQLLSLDELLKRLSPDDVSKVGDNVNNRTATDHWRLDPEITDELDGYIDGFARSPEAPVLTAENR